MTAIPYVVQIKSGTSAYPEHVRAEQPEYSGRGRPPAPRYRDKPSSLKDLALTAGKRATRAVTWRQGSRGRMHSRFLALRVRPANHQLRASAHAGGSELALRWLLVEWPSHAPEPTDYWLSSLPADCDLKTLVGLAKLRWRIEHDYRNSRTPSA